MTSVLLWPDGKVSANIVMLVGYWTSCIRYVINNNIYLIITTIKAAAVCGYISSYPSMKDHNFFLSTGSQAEVLIALQLYILFVKLNTNLRENLRAAVNKFVTALSLIF